MLKPNLEIHIADMIRATAQQIFGPAVKDLAMIDIHDDGLDKATAVDLAMEEALTQNMRTLFPDTHILGEEGVKDSSGKTDHDKVRQFLNQTGTLIVIDPLDGTNYFLNQKGGYGVLVAIMQRHSIDMPWDIIGAFAYDALDDSMIKLSDPVPVTLPRQKSLIHLGYERRILDTLTPQQIKNFPFDVTAQGPSAVTSIKDCFNERVDGFVFPATSPWDFFAGIALLRKAGFTICDWRGASLGYTHEHPERGIIAARTEQLATDIIRHAIPLVR